MSVMKYCLASVKQCKDFKIMNFLSCWTHVNFAKQFLTYFVVYVRLKRSYLSLTRLNCTGVEMFSNKKFLVTLNKNPIKKCFFV